MNQSKRDLLFIMLTSLFQLNAKQLLRFKELLGPYDPSGPTSGDLSMLALAQCIPSIQMLPKEQQTSFVMGIMENNENVFEEFKADTNSEDTRTNSSTRHPDEYAAPPAPTPVPFSDTECGKAQADDFICLLRESTDKLEKFNLVGDIGNYVQQKNKIIGLLSALDVSGLKVVNSSNKEVYTGNKHRAVISWGEETFRVEYFTRIA